MEIEQPGGGGSALTVVGGLTTVLNVSEIDFIGATVTDLGGGIASVSITATSPALPFTSIQFNDSGSFGGDADFTWDNSGKVAGIGGDILFANGADRYVTIDNAPPASSGAILITPTIVSGGSGYLINDVVDVVGGDSNAQLTINSLGPATITAINLFGGGSGYVAGNTYFLYGGNGDATIVADTVNGSGDITACHLVSGGTGYNVPATSIAIGGDNGCYIFLTAGTGAASSLTITAAGTNYAYATTLTTTGGSGSGLTINVPASPAPGDNLYLSAGLGGPNGFIYAETKTEFFDDVILDGYLKANNFKILTGGNTNAGFLDFGSLSSDQSFIFPDQSGTVALLNAVNPPNDFTLTGDIILSQGADRIIRVGAQATLNTMGNRLSLVAGSGNGSGDGGIFTIDSGQGGTTGKGGILAITSGYGGATSGDAGDVQISAGSAQGGNSNGGGVTALAGSGYGAGSGGGLSYQGGQGGATGGGGGLIFTAGAGGATSGVGGYVSLSGGNATGGDSNGGPINIRPGAKSGSGVDGVITLFTNGTASVGAILDMSLIASSSKTFTFPNASGTFAVSASGNIALSALGNITFTGQLPIANGGTGATSLLGAGIITASATVALVNQAADITTTTLTGTAGTYLVTYVLEDTTSDLTAGAVTLTFGWTDGAGATTLPSSAQLLTGLGRTSGTAQVQLASGNLTYATSHTGIFGTAKYALYISVLRLS